MFQSQQSSLTYFPTSSNSIPNSLLSFPQTPSLPSHPLLFRPPDLCAHLGQLTLTHFDFEPRPRLYEDPNAASPSWITTPTYPITYGTAHDVCNVVCKTKDVCKRHLMGKNHPRNLQAMINPLIFGASGVANFHELDRKKQQLLNAGAPVGSIRVRLIAIDGIGPYLAAIQANDQFWNKGKKITKNKISQPTWCEVCQINCNSSNVYAKHLSGKKHLKNLQNLEKSKNSTCYSSSIDTPIAANLLIGAVENPATDGCSGADAQKPKKMIARSEAAKEDLETKKQKVMGGGAAATAIRVCVICNVVCNSQTVFNYHLTGQKHATMVKKLANGRIPTVTPQTR
ncbi:hypothetical protein Gotur_012972 [Gossypium turneri]